MQKFLLGLLQKLGVMPSEMLSKIPRKVLYFGLGLVLSLLAMKYPELSALDPQQYVLAGGGLAVMHFVMDLVALLKKKL